MRRNQPMKYIYKAKYFDENGDITDICVVPTLEEAKKSSNEFIKEHPAPLKARNCRHVCAPRIIIAQEPETGVDLITHWRLPYENGYKRWKTVDDSSSVRDVVNYRGVEVKVYIDDYGQSYYIRWRNKYNQIESANCGAYNPDYMGMIEYFIDNMLDHIAGGNMFEPYYGVSLDYQDHDHKKIVLTYRRDIIQIYDSAMFDSDKDAINQAKLDIDLYCHSPEYLKEEAERLEAIKNGDTGKMYLHELMEKSDSDD